MSEVNELGENFDIEQETVIIDEQLKNWLKSTLKDNLRINDDICNEFINFSTTSFRIGVDNGDGMLLIVLEKVFPEITDGEIFEGLAEGANGRDNFRIAELVDHTKIKSAVKFQSKKQTKKKIKKFRKPKSKSPVRQSKSKSPARRRSKSKSPVRRAKSKSPTRPKSKPRSTTTEKKKKPITKSAVSSKKQSQPPSRSRSLTTVSPSKPKSAAEHTADGKESAHSRDSDSIRFFLEDELEEAAPVKEEDTLLHHKTFDTEDHGEWELRLLNDKMPDHQSIIVKTVFYLLKKSDDISCKLTWPDNVTSENITLTLLKHYFIGFVHNYASLNCTMESILEILSGQLSEPKQNRAMNLSLLAFHVTCQSPEGEQDLTEVDSLSEFAIFFCKNSMQIVEDFQFIFGLSSNIKSLLGQNDVGRFNEMINKINTWIDECQKMLGRDNFTRKKDQKNIKTLLDFYCRNYLVAKYLKLDFDGICNFEANSLQFTKLTKTVPRLDTYSNLLNQYLTHRKSVVQYLLPLYCFTTIDAEHSSDVDYDLIEIILQTALNFCSEFKNVESLKNLIESICIDLVSLIGYKMQPKILFMDGSLIKNFHETQSFVTITSKIFLNWRNKLDRMLKNFRNIEKFDENYEIWMKVLNQALQTSQYLIEFLQMLSAYFEWLYQKNEDENVVEQKDKCWDILEEIEKDLQQVVKISYDIFTSIGHTSWKRTIANISAKLKTISIL